MTVQLNPDLIKQQKLTKKEVKRLQELHAYRERVFADMELETDPAALRGFAERVENIEFMLQEAWRFPQDAQKHSWWFQVPHCQCPKLDNWERVGTGQRIINGDCPVHGFEEETSRLPEKPLC